MYVHVLEGRNSMYAAMPPYVIQVMSSKHLVMNRLHKLIFNEMHAFSVRWLRKAVKFSVMAV